MSSDFVAMAVAEFGVVPREPGGWLESRSGAAVRAVRTSDGRPAYLKATPVTAGPRVLADARRELRFYRDLAPVVPVRTPRLLGWSEAEDGVAVLLAAAGEAREAGSWTAGTWSRLGRELAALHAMPQPREAGWDAPDGLRAALADPDLDRISAFWSPVLPQLAEFAARRDELAERFGSVPPAFIHGDCHTGNIVHEGGALVFCDWQVTGIGRPVSDLALLSVRGTPGGLRVPPALLDAYLDTRLDTCLDTCLDTEAGDHRALRAALVVEELAIFVFQWPAYAALNSPEGNDLVRRRARELAKLWARNADGRPGLE